MEILLGPLHGKVILFLCVCLTTTWWHKMSSDVSSKWVEASQTCPTEFKLETYSKFCSGNDEIRKPELKESHGRSISVYSKKSPDLKR